MIFWSIVQHTTREGYINIKINLCGEYNITLALLNIGLGTTTILEYTGGGCYCMYPMTDKIMCF